MQNVQYKKKSDVHDWDSDIETAQQLCYPKTVIEMLRNEPNSNRRKSIMGDARRGKYGGRWANE